VNRSQQPSDQVTSMRRDLDAERLADIHGGSADVPIDRPDPEQYVRREILLTAEKMFARELERSRRDAAFSRSVALVTSGACAVLTILSIILWLSAGR
jgi:hypothetical protein